MRNVYEVRITPFHDLTAHISQFSAQGKLDGEHTARLCQKEKVNKYKKEKGQKYLKKKLKAKKAECKIQ
jgi:hypothetical protein